MKPLLLRAGLLLLASLVAVFIVVQVLAMRGDLGAAPELERPWLIALAVLVLAGAPLSYAFLWRTIVGRLDNVYAPIIDTLTVFYVTWLGRYVPSSLPYVAGKFVMGQRLGHSRHALAASVVYENVLVIGIGIVSSSLIIPIALADEGSNWLLYAGGLLGGIGAIALVSPGVTFRLASVLARVAGRETLTRGDVLSYRGLASAASITSAALVFNAVGFALIVAAFHDLSAAEMIAAGAAFNLAGVLGVLAIPIPSGLGVREAVLIGLLQLFVPIEVAAAAAVVSRLVSIGTDVALGLLAGGIMAMRHQSPAPVGPLAPQPLELP